MEATHLNLVPPQLDSVADIEEFIQSGRTLSASMSPVRNSLNAFIGPNDSLITGQKSSDFGEQPIYVAGTSLAPSLERRIFVTDTSVIFTALQNLTQPAQSRGPEWLRSDETRNAVRKLTVDYVNFAKECWVHTSTRESSDESTQFSSDHYRALYSTFSLFLVLYLPEDGLEDIPVGDELMEWLNVHFIEPSTEEGDQLSALDKPWMDESFWSYLIRSTLRGFSKACIFFLKGLSSHPSEHLQQLSLQLIPLMDSHPRLQDFASEREFASASKRWKDKVKAVRTELDRVPAKCRNQGSESWWARLSDLVGVLEGRGEVIQKVCEELGADWKELCAAWGVFVDPRLRRQDLPDLVGQILEDMPADSTNLEDMVHATLAAGQSSDALSHAEKLDVWLAAHMADVMSSIELIDNDTNIESELSMRDEYVLAYADYLQSDPGCWRLTVEYMCSCGELGRARADEVLLRVPLHLCEDTAEEKETSMTLEDIRAGDVTGVLKEINQTCFQYQREGVRRTICRIAAQAFVQERNYGLAVSYCTSAEDWPGLGRIIDSILNEYIVNGPETFTRLVANIAPSLQSLRSHSGPRGIFIHRLMFAVRYAEFHHRRMSQEMREAALDLITMFSEGLAPHSWWGVLLCDAIELLQCQSTLLFTSAGACELLRRVDEVFIRTEQGGGDDYLDVLMQMSRGGVQEALHKLKAVRLALARYFARCAIVSGGRRPELPPQGLAPTQVPLVV